MGVAAHKRTVVSTAEVWSIETPLDAKEFAQLYGQLATRCQQLDDYYDDAYTVTSDESEITVTFRPKKKED